MSEYDRTSTSTTHPSIMISGQQRAWNLLEKLGEGDAGEVYRVESLIDHRIAIMKRPRRSAFPSDIIRQAGQIEKEGQVLEALAHLETPRSAIHTPVLLDQSKPGSAFSERFFIVITPATGFNLANMARAIHFGIPTRPEVEPSGEPIITPGFQLASMVSFPIRDLTKTPTMLQSAFLERLIKLGKLPDLILLRALAGLIDYLEAIHVLSSDTPSGKTYGILWNDVKPEHFFYDPLQSTFTIIDWGNAQFLEMDGVTKDRQHSRIGDYSQLLNEMGRFLADIAPELKERLAWPAETTPGLAYSEGILPLKERLAELLQAEEANLRQVRRAEADLLGSASIDYEGLKDLAQLHSQILSFGEIPDYQGAERFFLHLGSDLIINKDLARFGDLCRLANAMPTLDAERCQILGQMAAISAVEELPATALLAGLNADWPTALWELRLAALETPEPAWWESLSNAIRNLETSGALERAALTQEMPPQESSGHSDLVLRPLVALNRLLHALQAATISATDPTPFNALIATLKDVILPRWLQAEPDPPDSGIEYREVERFIEQAATLMPEAILALQKALNQPRAQATIAMDAWNRQDFITARSALRRMLLWDPDYRRLLIADRALERAPAWLAEVRRGLTTDEPLGDLVSRLELSGRELRNQLGAAGWLDALLDALRQLRKGADPTDVLVQSTEVREDLSWLISLEPRRPLLTSSDKPIELERLALPQDERPALYGTKDSPLNQAGGLMLSEPLDTWTPEARGSSARLFLGMLPWQAAGVSSDSLIRSGSPPAAIKIMRPDRIEYALPLFREEARILSLLRDVPGVVPMLECGFIHLFSDSETGQSGDLPPEEHGLSASQLRGEVHRYGPDSVHNFLADLETRIAQGWLPYLGIEKQERADNLLLHCDTGYTGGRFLPTLEGLVMAIQCCDILEAAHARNIIYRDHKILHYYWQDEYNGIFMIDWNIARRYPEGLRESDIQFDLVQFGARALHYMLTGRAAPGALPLGPNKPEEIEAAARTYDVRWTYDDQRLPKDIKELLEGVLAGNYLSAKVLREDLHTIYVKLSELVARSQ